MSPGHRVGSLRGTACERPRRRADSATVTRKSTRAARTGIIASPDPGAKGRPFSIFCASLATVWQLFAGFSSPWGALSAVGQPFTY
jgi:hypothetical protein